MAEASLDFVCVADEVWRLQRGADHDAVFFQQAVNDGQRISDGGTRQGFWVLSPGGQSLAYANSRNPEQVLAVLTAGRAAWEALPAEQRRLPDGAALEPAHRWEWSAPADGLQLDRISRELPFDGLHGPRSERWNRDRAWFSRDEVDGMLPPDPQPGQQFALPLLAQRLARFHLTDDVRGQSIPYAPAEVQRAELQARVLARHGSELILALHGSTLCDADGPWLLGENSWRPFQELPHGLESRLLGQAVFDLDSRTFTELELVAVARHWGRTENNGRKLEPEPGLLAFRVSLAPRDGVALAPSFASLYEVDWIARPSVPTWRASPSECEDAPAAHAEG